MNKLIRDLAEQAGYIPGEITSEAFNEFRFDTFVELIVNEALTISDVKSAAFEIREHFGLKHPQVEVFKKKCPTQEANGGTCPLHNLHCQYPDCLK